MNPEIKTKNGSDKSYDSSETIAKSEEIENTSACYLKVIEEICNLKDRVKVGRSSTKKAKFKWVY